MSQNKVVLKHLKEIGPLTTTWAFERYGILRLAARINELRKSTRIGARKVVVRNGHTVAEYFLIEGGSKNVAVQKKGTRSRRKSQAGV